MKVVAPAHWEGDREEGEREGCAVQHCPLLFSLSARKFN